MKRCPPPAIILAWLLLLAMCPEEASASLDEPNKVPTPAELAKNFVQPPPEARPWVYWFWLNGNITREGITADLEAMKRAGIGGVVIFEVDLGVPAGPVHFGSLEWREMFKFVVTEADRLGLKVTMNNAAGWCGSGGPWITPELSEQKLVWTETPLQGPSHFDGVLPKAKTFAGWFNVDKTGKIVQPKADTRPGYYKEVAVLAFPTPPTEDVPMSDNPPKITIGSISGGVDPQQVLAGGTGAILISRPAPGKPEYVQIEFARPFTARTLQFMLDGGPIWAGFEGELQASDDGSHFKTIRPLAGQLKKMTFMMDPVTARCFRIVFARADSNVPEKMAFSRLKLTPAGGVDRFQEKSLEYRGEIFPQAAYPKLPPDAVVDRSRVIDLTSRMDADGRLAWDVPEGRWTILRIGQTNKGQVNHPAPKEGLGFECDKLSKEAMDAQFAGLMKKLIADADGLAGKSLASTHIDSWETGVQSWTARFPEEFQARRGYDLHRFLPVLTGRVIDSPEVSDRFLWDFRKTVSDLLNENYAGRLAELAHANGLRLSIEAYGGLPGDNMTFGARADDPMCEFWRLPPGWPGKSYRADIEMPSVAHVYGKPIVPAEAFTCPDDEKWLAHPASLKTLGDWAYCMGINRLVIHRYAHQPWPDRKPGISMGPNGIHFEQTETWWEQSSAWTQYMTRCQHLLQQGLAVADLCCLDAEKSPGGFFPPVPPGPLPARPGYNYDGVTAEALLSLFFVKDGKLTVPCGMSYRALVLPEVETMTPALLRKIKSLVADGATVIGRPPLKSPSLSGYPACDDEVAAMARELWGDCDGKRVKEHAFGKGRVIAGREPGKFLAAMNVPPDFTCQDSKAGPDLLYTHRSIGGVDAYFVANKRELPVESVCSFRVSGKRPEFWWPQTGRIETPAAYEQKDGVTRVPMHLEAAESVFVVFREGGVFDPVVSLTLDKQPVLPPTQDRPRIVVQKALYGVPGKPESEQDVTARVQAIADCGEAGFHVAQLDDESDLGRVLKTVKINYTVNEQPHTASGSNFPTDGFWNAELKFQDYRPNNGDSDLIEWEPDATPAIPTASLRTDAKERLLLEARKPGTYLMRTASGKNMKTEVAKIPAPVVIGGPWDLEFPPGWGAPAHVVLERLISWSEHGDAGVQYFSGTAAYRKQFSVNKKMCAPGCRVYLNLGDVQVIAGVKLNGKDLGILWKPPYCVEVTGLLKPGKNALEVQVTNLWPNRMIGDEQMPEDSDRYTEGFLEDGSPCAGTLKAWPQWLLEGKPSPTGRLTFTSWRLWKKGDALLPSGLLGPVTLRTSVEVVVRADGRE